MTRKEAIRQTRQLDTLRSLGFPYNEAEALRRISMTLRRWLEQECGNSDERSSWKIERDGNEPDSKPYIVQHSHRENRTTRTPIADRETGARKRLAKITDSRPELRAYVQDDPRGAAR